MRHYNRWMIILLTLIVFRACPGDAFVNGQNAKYVLGQPNFTTNNTNLSATGMNSPDGIAYDPAGAGRLFVSDTRNGRVLVFDFNQTPIGNGVIPATYVLGKPDFTTGPSGIPNVSSMTISIPGGLAYDASHNRLFVADINYSRVLVYDFKATPIGNGISATYVLGQPNFTSDALGPRIFGLDQPTLGRSL